MLLALVLGFVRPHLAEVKFDSMLVVGPFASGGRTPCPTDPVAYQMVEDTFKPPQPSHTIEQFGKPFAWKELRPGKDEWYADGTLNGGYAYASFVSDKVKTMVLDASGHSMVYVNGVPRGGDPYGFGYVQLPVEIKKGRNDFLFSVGRGRLRAKLVESSGTVTVSPLDPTLPDAIAGEDKPLLCSVLVTNATNKPFSGAIHGDLDGHAGPENLIAVTPMTVKKVWFETAPVSVKGGEKLSLKVSLTGRPDSIQEFQIEAKLPTQTQKRTFRSSADGSVQYYAVQPATDPRAKALVLSLHGAGVEANGQAASYGQKPWCNIVCPTNGRPYGFDWEDWGRTNALDALADAKRVFKPDADRVYLTGHSMGGHGTWTIGLNEPDKFAAIAPCAGWISFWSYGGAADWKDPDPVETLLRRAANSSDTLKLLDNARNLGIYIQHGDKDDNVPVEQAREMRKRLGEFHRDFDWHEEPGQSHWFDTDPEAGANVQDYAPLFDFLSRHRIQAESERRMWTLTTVNPDGASRAANVEIIGQLRSLEPSQIEVRTYADGSYEEITTKNVSAIRLTPLGDSKSFKVKVNGHDTTVSLAGGDWDSNCFSVTDNGLSPLDDRTKTKDLSQEGGIKNCFNGGVVCVYGTGGTKAERDWAYNKARFDAETWWYRGNGSLDLEPDTWKPASSAPLPPVVFYGNPRTNKAIEPWLAFGAVKAKLPFTAGSNELEIGAHRLVGDLGLIWSSSVFKATGVGLIGGTTLKGCRAVERLPLFLSGVHYADVFVNRPEMYLTGSKGVVASGFYGPDWRVESGEFAFREP